MATVPTMFFAQQGRPLISGSALNTLVGGTLAAGAAGAFNCYIDRNEDRLMRRTAKRPLVTGEVSDRGPGVRVAAVRGGRGLATLG
ncbi:UbiA family prenyltransferase [Kocuria rhizophila]|nr:UbiA family prenyltransferase [Kocuria rhizophila]